MAAFRSSHLLSNKLFDVSALTAVVTGGGTGLGQMMAEALCANGAKVYIVGRRKEALDAVVEQYGSHGSGEIVALPGDISSKSDLQRIAKEVGQKEPRGIQLLINNAGVARDKDTQFSTVGEPDTKSAEAISKHFWNSSIDSWDETFRINVTGHFFTSLAFLTLLEKGHDITPGLTSSIINIASISGYLKRSSGGQFSYACSKAASLHLTRLLGTTLVDTRIRVNCIAPGIFPSEMTAGSSGADQKSKIERKLGNPMGRAGREEEIASCVLHLAGPSGQFFNGQTLHPDGGVVLVSPAAI